MNARNRKGAAVISADSPARAASAATLPAGRAFLVQLAGDCDPGSETVRGRVEHVRSGEATRFRSLPELKAFMMDVLRQDRRKTT